MWCPAGNKDCGFLRGDDGGGAACAGTESCRPAVPLLLEQTTCRRGPCATCALAGTENNGLWWTRGLCYPWAHRLSAPVYPELIDICGCYAQMLAAVIDHGEMVGLVAVHQLRGPRHWTDEEVGKLTSAVEEIRCELAKTSSQRPARARPRRVGREPASFQNRMCPSIDSLRVGLLGCWAAGACWRIEGG